MIGWLPLPRGRGKTSRAIRWAQQEQPGGPARYIVCSTTAEVRRVFDASRDKDGNPTIRFPIAIPEATGYHGRSAEFAVDDADHILQALMGAPVVLATYTQEPAASLDQGCGGCNGLGAHRRWCPARVGPRAARLGAFAERTEALADSIGGGRDTDLANTLYQVAEQLAERAESARAAWWEEQR